MAERETHSLIGSDKVDGTAVYGADQRKIGSVERVMIDKLSGKVAYAVISYGGFLGMGELACLQLAHAYDEATGWVGKRPPSLLGKVG